jgi:hypothetical protein
MDEFIRNLKIPGVSEGAPLQGSNKAGPLRKHNIFHRKKFKELLCNIPFFGGLFKRLFNRKVEVIDPNAQIEERLPSLVKAAQEGNPQHLTDALLRLESKALKEVFIDGKNGILDLLVEDKTSEPLVWVLSRLDPDSLNEVLSHSNNKILNLLVEKEYFEPLA